MFPDPVTDQFSTELFNRGCTPQEVTLLMRKQAYAESPFWDEYEVMLCKIALMKGLGAIGTGVLGLGAAYGIGKKVIGGAGKPAPTPPKQPWVSGDAMSAFGGAKPPAAPTAGGASSPSLFIRPDPSAVQGGPSTPSGTPGRFGMASDLQQLTIRRQDINKRLAEMDAKIKSAPLGSDKLLLTRQRQGLVTERDGLESQWAPQYQKYDQNRTRMTSSVDQQIKDLQGRVAAQNGQQSKMTESLLAGENPGNSPTTMMQGWWNKLTGKEDKLRAMEQQTLTAQKSLEDAQAWQKQLASGYTL